MLRLALLSLALAAPALASSPFPVTIKNHLGLATTPRTSCTLCHNNGITGRDTVNTPIGKALRARGAVSTDEAKLRAALDQLEADGVDSDGDGTQDVAELRVGRDPNRVDVASDGGTGTDGGTIVDPGPGALTYGCGADVVPSLSAFALLALAGLRRRRP